MSHTAVPMREVMKTHIQYMDRYYANPRESDKKISAILRNLIAENHHDSANLSLLDVGCMTGNLSHHLKHEFPRLKLTASDIDPYAIEVCRQRSELKDVDFKVIDILAPNEVGNYDFVVSSVSFFEFDEKKFDQAVRNVSSLLRIGGWFILFDLIHEFDQYVEIKETSKNMTDLAIYFRPISNVRRSLEGCGFENIRTEPFVMPFDLEKSADPENIDSYTIKTEQGERMTFRGTLYQPWCHLWAQKGG